VPCDLLTEFPLRQLAGICHTRVDIGHEANFCSQGAFRDGARNPDAVFGGDKRQSITDTRNELGHTSGEGR
jgi:hypothetical protein